MPRAWPLYLGVVLSPLAGSGVIALLEAYQQDFGVGVAVAGLAITTYMAPYAALQLFSGSASDVAGRRRVLTAGFLTFGLGSLACGLSTTMAAFLAARSLQGLGGALINPVLIAAIGDHTTAAERGTAMGHLGVVVAGAIVAGPLAAGVVHVAVGWRWFFLAMAAASALFAIVYNRFLAGETPGGGGVARAAALLREGLTRRDVLLAGVASFATFLTVVAIQSYASDFMAEAPLRLREDRVGLALALGGAVGFVASPLAGRATDRLGRVPAILIGFGLVAAGGVAIALAATAPTFPRMVAALAVTMAGLYTLFAAFGALTVELMPDAMGTPASVYNFFRFMGYAAAPVAFAPAYAWRGLPAVGAAAALVALAALLISRRLPETAPRRSGPTPGQPY